MKDVPAYGQLCPGQLGRDVGTMRWAVIPGAAVQTPYRASGSPSYFFYSVNVGPSHNIFLSNYIDYTVGSQQYIWLKAYLRNIDRSQTPWVTVNFHNPW